jgi:hypothetical protein
LTMRDGMIITYWLEIIIQTHDSIIIPGITRKLKIII